jgi:hypothetical protein
MADRPPTTPERLALDYRTAFLRYLPRREEVALTAAYNLGRTAVTTGISLLELVRIHHEVLAGVLVDTRPDELAATAESASTFLLEVLAPFDLGHRRLLDPR